MKTSKRKVKFAMDKKSVPPGDQKQKEEVKGAGIAIQAKDTGRVLFIKRSPTSNHPGEWDLSGGHCDAEETPEQTARRETREETGAYVSGKLEQMSDTKLPDDSGSEVNFITYHHICNHEFKPKLDKSEHTEYKWCDPRDPPEPLHPGVKQTLDSELANDAGPLSAAAMRLGHAGGLSSSPAKVAAARINGAKHVGDAALAFDKASVRTFDADGRLKVETSNISRAMVCPYLGSEIPDPAGVLNLDPNKIYKLFRDPEELEKAASTFNSIQLLCEHVPVSTTDIQKDIIIGCTGDNAVFEFPFLKNSLCVWKKEGIEGVESKEAQEISCSYRYDADMTPGEFEGEKFDGVMRNLHGNHVILTPAGRCGATVVVGDSALAVPPSSINLKPSLEKKAMSNALSKKALRVRGVLQAVPNTFAADKKPDFDTILTGVDKKNWLEKKPAILGALKPSLAADADIEALTNLLDSLDGSKPDDKDMGADAVEGILAHCRGKMSDDELGELEGKVRALTESKKADDEESDMKPIEKPGVKAAADEDDDKDEKKDKDMVPKKAMDKAIQAATKLAEDNTIARINGIHEARSIAKPFVGEIAVACDSASEVYRAALKILGMPATKVDSLHVDALRPILEAQPNPNAKRETPTFAGDSAHVSGLDGFLTELGLPH